MSNLGPDVTVNCFECRKVRGNSVVILKIGMNAVRGTSLVCSIDDV
jgi:hypothetical protein